MVFSISIGGNTADDKEEKEILADLKEFIKKHRKSIAGAVWSGTDTGSNINLTE
jgi:hypothetical protein